MNKYTKELIKISLETGALKLNVKNPFLWASGYYMPVYNDNRLFLSSKKHREMIADAFIEIIKREKIVFDVVAGTSTAGIPHGTTLADKLNLPLTYVRSKPKDHGLKNRIEGLSADKGYEGKRVILIEDLVSTGGSSISAVKAIRDAGGVIQYCLSIFTYELQKGIDNFASLTPPCITYSIITYHDLVTEALRMKYISPAEEKTLEDWAENPFAWGGMK